MEDSSNSLTIELFGIKATALGTLPVAGLLTLMAIICVSAVFVGRGHITYWAKRIGKSGEE
jgi:hypothetical protein